MFCLPAQAAEPVVLHDASVKAQVAQRLVAPLGDTPAAAISTLTPSELRADGGVTSWPLKLQGCESESVELYDLREALQRVEGHLNYSRVKAADQGLATTRDLLVCLKRPTPPTMAAKVFFLSGILDAEEGRLDTAKGHFAQSLAIYPALTWDENYSPKSGLSLFEEAKQAQEAQALGTLHAVPGTAAYAVWVDGVALSPESASRDLVPGRHLVQIGSPEVTSYWAEIRSYDALYVFIRNEVPESAVTWATNPDLADDLSALLASTVGQGTPVYVVASKNNVVFANAGDTPFQPVQPAVSAVPSTEPAPTDPSRKTSRRDPHDYTKTTSSLSGAQLLTRTGSALTLGAGAWALQAKLKGNRLYLECWDGTEHNARACADNESAYETVRTQLPIATGITIGGAAIAGLGLTWGKNVSVSPFGAGLQLTVSQ